MSTFEFILLFIYLYGCFLAAKYRKAIQDLHREVTGGDPLNAWYEWPIIVIGSWFSVKASHDYLIETHRDMVKRIIEEAKADAKER